MFDLTTLVASTRQPGLPPSLMRPNSGPGDAFAGLPGPISEEQALENVNAAPWSKRFAANFIEPGPCLYRGQGGAGKDEMVVLEADALARMAPTLIGKPVIDWDHAEVWPEILGDGQGDGVVYDVWKDSDGWWHCGFILWTKSAIAHAESGDWSVSCAYKETETDGKAGRHHSIDYDFKILDGFYTHLALVKKPRYENARIRANSDGTGGFKMSWSLFKPKADDKKVLRLNADDAAKTHLEVDGEPVGIKDLVAKHNAMHDAPSNVLTASDDDMVEHEGRSYKVGDLRNAHRNAMARHNAEEEKKEKEEKEKKERENAARARRNDDTQLKGAGAEKAGKLAGQGSDKAGGPEDNPDKALEAAKEISALKDRLNSAEELIKELKTAPSRELRDAAHLRVAPAGGVPEGQGFVTGEDRIRRGNQDFAV